MCGPRASGGDAGSASPTPETLRRLIAIATALPTPATLREGRLAGELFALQARLQAKRLQVAVVGQFKRGKSSLLNALLGREVLPAGMLPVTGLPTFLQAAARDEAMVVFRDGRSEILEARTTSEVRNWLEQYVGEQGNPDNAKRVARVEVGLTAEVLAPGVVLIDTPGIGSTLAHNTVAAEAALPQCDAALLVVSPDPPITQAEIDYLEKVRANAAVVLVVLNKIDLLQLGETAPTLDFLRKALASGGLDAAEIFPVSARLAAKAREARDLGAATASGVPALASRLASLIDTQGAALLIQAIAKKALRLVRELGFENDVALAGLTTPLDQLAARLEGFAQASQALEQERERMADLVAGDRRRLLAELDSAAERLRVAMTARLTTAFEAKARTLEPEAAWREVRASIADLFEAALRDTTAEHQQRLAAALTAHQAQADALLDRVRALAADFLDLPAQAPTAQDAFEAASPPYWVDQPRETLAALPAGLLERLLPKGLGRPLARRRIHGEIDEVTRRDVENLRWALRQSTEESLRRFMVRASDALAGGVQAVVDGVAMARRTREAEGAAAEALVAQRRTRAEALAGLDLELCTLSGTAS